MQRPVLKVKQVAARLSLSVSKIYELIEEGHLPVHKLGGTALRVSEEDLKSFIETSRVDGKRGAGKAQSLPPRARPTPRVKLKHIKL